MATLWGTLWFLVVACFVSVIFAATSPDLKIQGRYVILNGERYFMKGVGYSPVPIGHQPGDGYDINNVPGIYNRDLALLKAMGANTIRIYGWTNGNNYDNFLNACQANGISVMLQLYFAGVDITNSTQVASLQASWVSMINTYKNNPAIIMWILGNEVNGAYGDTTTLYNFLNNMCAAAHAADDTRFCTTTFLDSSLHGATGLFGAGNSLMPNVDVYNVQLYRGNSFFGFFQDYALRSTKPIFVSEFGADAYSVTTNSVDYTTQTSFIMNLWNEISIYNNITSGGLPFEYCDEWWKCSGSSPSIQDTCGGANNEPDDSGNNEWYGLFSIALNQTDNSAPNILTARPVVAQLTQAWLSTNPTAPPTTAPTTTKAPGTGHALNCVPSVLLLVLLVFAVLFVQI